MHFAAGHRYRHRIGAGFDPIRQHGVSRAVKLAHAFDDDTGRAGAGHARAHLVQAGGDIEDFRLASGIGDDRRAPGQGCRHQRDMGAAHRHLGKFDVGAVEPARCFRDHITAVDDDFRAELLQRHDQQIDRPCADGAAAGQRDLGFVHPRQQRRDHPEAGAHPRH